jgi:hypothetical protein
MTFILVLAALSIGLAVGFKLGVRERPESERERIEREQHEAWVARMRAADRRPKPGPGQ